MKTKWLFCILNLLFVGHLFAQQSLPIEKEGKWGLISTEGEVLLPPTYQFISQYNESGQALFRDSGREGLLNSTGEILVPATYEKISPTPLVNTFIYWENGLCGLINASGEVKLQAAYGAISLIKNNLFRVFVEGKVGIAHADGRLLLPAEYQTVEPIGHPYFIKVTTGNQQGVFTEIGGLLAKKTFDEIQLEAAAFTGKNGMAVTRVTIDERGQVVDLQEYPNETALRTALATAERKKAAQLLKQNPEARKPRWVQRGFPYTLENGAGQNLLGSKDFYELNFDEKTGLSFVKESVKAEQAGEEDKVICYVLEHEQVKLWFALEATDLMLTDFGAGEWARASIDTLWDALVHKSGRGVRGKGGKKITNVGNFAHERAWVQSGNTFGYIDTRANLVLPFEFEAAGDFEEGVAIGRKNGKFGCFDPNGKILIPFQYDGIGQPSGGVCRVKQGTGRAGKWGLIDFNGKQLAAFAYSVIYPFKNGLARVQGGKKWGFIDAKGNIKMTLPVQADFVDDFTKGIAQVGIGRRVEQTGIGPTIRYDKIGYIKENGDWLIAPEYSRIEGMETCWSKQQGLALLVKDGKLGYADYQGNVVLPAEYDMVNGFDTIWTLNKGIVQVKKAGKIGYLDHNAKEVVKADYDWIAPDFEQAFADSTGWVIAVKNGLYGCLDHQGEIVIPFEHQLISATGNGLAITQNRGKWGVINQKQEKILPFEFAGIRFLEGSENRLLQVLQEKPVSYFVFGDGRLQPVESAGISQNTAMLPQALEKYELVSTFPELGLAVVEKNGSQALATLQGKLLTKFNYLKIEPFQEGLSAVQIDHKDRSQRHWGYINTKGEEVISPVYKQVASFSNGLAAVVERGSWVYIDQKGQTAIKNQFKQALPFSDGKTLVNGNQIIDKNGNSIGVFTLEGEFASGFQSNRAIIKSLSGSYHIRPDGKPAYFQKYDEVTPFIGEYAFVKKGEVWELPRTVQGEQLTIRFSASNKAAYLQQYGKYRSQKMHDGRKIKDGEFVKVENGKWRMIDKNGAFVNDLIFNELEIVDGERFKAGLSTQMGLADGSGKWIAQPSFEQISQVGAGIYKLEKAGKVGYLDVEGNWIWSIP